MQKYLVILWFSTITSYTITFSSSHLCFPKWAFNTVSKDKSLAGDPIISFHIHYQYCGTIFLIHSIPTIVQTFLEALGVLEWDNAMDGEYFLWIKNHACYSVSLPFEGNMVHCKWVFYPKYVIDGYNN